MPDIAIIGVTTGCNSRCSYCDVWSQQIGTDVPIEFLINAVKAVGRLGVKLLALTGGEPLLVNNLEVLIEKAKVSIPLVTLSTNGILLSRTRVASLACVGLDALIISLDTLNADNYMRLRGVSIEHVLHGIEEAIIEMGCIRLVISSVVSLHNLLDLPQLARFCMENNIILGLNALHNKNSQPTPEEQEMPITIHEVHRIMEEIRAMTWIGLDIANTSAHLDGLEMYLTTGSLPIGNTCQNVTGSITISCDGFVRICPYMKPIGCLLDTDISDLWNSDAKRMMMDQMQRLDCPGCWHSYRVEKFESARIEKLLSKSRGTPIGG